MSKNYYQICHICSFINNYVINSQEIFNHKLIDFNIKCPLCCHDKVWASHLYPEFLGDSLECIKCHNYIYHTDNYLVASKEEFYIKLFNKNYLLITNFEEDITSLLSIDSGFEKHLIDFNGILKFNSVANLYKKVSSILTFL